jgi:diguanylate cyclase (GGDEF)-like protein/PAS domain S-box-containing protein
MAMPGKSTAGILQKFQSLQKRLVRTEKLARLGHWCLDLATSKMRWSEEVFHLFDKDPRTFTASHNGLLDSVHPDDREPLIESIKHYLSSKDAFSLEYRIMLSDGSTRYLQQRTEVSRDAAGNPRRLFGTVQDITERKMLERELEKANAYLESLIENSPDPISIVDAKGKIIRWNRAAEDIYGYNALEIEGKPYQAFYADPGELNSMVKKLRKDGFVRNYEITMRRKGGEIFPATMSISLLPGDDHQVMGSIAVARDMTEMTKTMIALQQTNDRLQILLQETEQCNRETNIINFMSEQLQSCLSCSEAYPIIAQQAQDLFLAASGALFMLDPVHNMVEAVATWGQPLAGEQVFPSHDCWALRRGRLRWTGDPILEMPCRHMASSQTENYLCVPLLAQGETLGMLHIQGINLASQERNESMRRLAATTADHISLALANIKLRETLRYQVIHDPLTDLFNRRYLEETLVRELYRVRRRNAPLGLIMLDLDHFKKFNDTFGHEAGDSLLRALGKYLLAQVRHEDVACRYGGEEFVLILPEAPLQAVVARAEAIRLGVLQLQLSQQGQLLESTSVSLGVAMFPEHGVSGENLLQAADNAMYQAKMAGRNRVVVADQSNPTLGSVSN